MNLEETLYRVHHEKLYYCDNEELMQEQGKYLDMLFAYNQLPPSKGEEKKAEALIKSLYAYFVENPDKLPSSFWQTSIEEGAARASCDYVASMSDSYVLSVYHRIFIPKAWLEKGF